jgi:hypothetical protein
MKHIRFSFAWIVVLMASMWLSACSSDDGLKTAEVIVGTWTLDSYRVEGDEVPEGITVNVQRVTFTADGHFTVVLPDGSNDGGTYEAGDDFVRFDYSDSGGAVSQRVLCEVLSVSEQLLTLHYRDADYQVAVTVTLRRL